MTIATYADLLTKLQEYNDDATSVITSVAPDMITLAEARIFNGFDGDFYSPPLRCKAIEAVTIFPVNPSQDGGTSGGTSNVQTVTLAAPPALTTGLSINFVAGFTNTGAMTLNPNSLGDVTVKKGRFRDDLDSGDIQAGGYYSVYHDGTQFVLMPSVGSVPLPSRWMGAKSAYNQDRGSVLTQMPASGVNAFMSGSAGTPLYYADETDCLRFDPAPSQNSKISMTYYRRPLPLVTALNDVFRDAPNIYLYASLLELAIFLPDETNIPKWYSNFASALNGYMNSNRRQSVGYGPMRLRMANTP